MKWWLFSLINVQSCTNDSDTFWTNEEHSFIHHKIIGQRNWTSWKKNNEANEANFSQTFLSCFYFIFSEHFNEVFWPTTRTVLAGKTSSSQFSLLFLVVIHMPEPPASIHLYTVQLQCTTLRPGQGNWWKMHLETARRLHQPRYFRENWINTWIEHLLRRMLIQSKKTRGCLSLASPPGCLSVTGGLIWSHNRTTVPPTATHPAITTPCCVCTLSI